MRAPAQRVRDIMRKDANSHPRGDRRDGVGPNAGVASGALDRSPRRKGRGYTCCPRHVGPERRNPPSHGTQGGQSDAERRRFGDAEYDDRPRRDPHAQGTGRLPSPSSTAGRWSGSSRRMKCLASSRVVPSACVARRSPARAPARSGRGLRRLRGATRRTQPRRSRTFARGPGSWREPLRPQPRPARNGSAPSGERGRWFWLRRGGLLQKTQESARLRNTGDLEYARTDVWTTFRRSPTSGRLRWSRSCAASSSNPLPGFARRTSGSSGNRFGNPTDRARHLQPSGGRGELRTAVDPAADGPDLPVRSWSECPTRPAR